jgi:hypothetical protein
MRGEKLSAFGVSSVARPKLVTEIGFAVGLSGNIGMSIRAPIVRVRFGRTRHWSPT